MCSLMIICVNVILFITNINFNQNILDSKEFYIYQNLIDNTEMYAYKNLIRNSNIHIYQESICDNIDYISKSVIENDISYINSIYEDDYDFSDLDGFSDNVYSEIFSYLIMGQVDSALTLCKDAIINDVTKELIQNKKILAQIIIIVIIGAIFSNLSTSFADGFAGENGFYVTYLLMIAVLSNSYTLAYDIAYDAVRDILDIMKSLIPVFTMSLAATGNITTSVATYNLLVMGVGATQWLILNIILPLVNMYVLLSLINNISTEDRFSKLSNLIKNICEWSLKSIMALIIGLNTIKSIVTPAFDSVKTQALEKSIAVAPGGQIVSAFSSVLIGSSVIIKNGVGVAGMLILLVVVSVPLIKLLIFLMAYRILAAALQPIADKRMVQGLQSLSDGNGLLMKSVMAATVLFVLSIAIVTVATGG